MLNDALKTTLNRRFEHHTAQPLFRSLTRRRDAHLFTHSRQRTWKNSSGANRFPKIPPLFLIYSGSVCKRKGAAEKCVYCTRHTLEQGEWRSRASVCPRLRYFNVLFIWSRSQVLWSHRELLRCGCGQHILREVSPPDEIYPLKFIFMRMISMCCVRV